MARQGAWWSTSLKGSAQSLYTCLVCPGASVVGRLLVLLALVFGVAAAVQAVRCTCLAGWPYQCLVTAPLIAVLGALCSWKRTKVSPASKGGSVVSMDHLADPHRPMPFVGTAACLLAACHVMVAACILQSNGLIACAPGAGPSFQFLTFTGLRFAVLVLWMLIVLSNPDRFRAVSQSEPEISTNENGPKMRRWVQWFSVLPLALLVVGVCLCVSGENTLSLGLVCVLTAPFILLQWLFGAHVLASEWRIITWSLLPTCAYFLLVDRLALARDSWSVNVDHSVLLVGGYPCEMIGLWVLVAMVTVQGILLAVRVWEYFNLLPTQCGGPLQRLLASAKRLHHNGSWSRQAALPSTHNYVALPLDD